MENKLNSLIDDPLPLLRVFGLTICLIFTLLTLICPVKAKEIVGYGAQNSEFNPKFTDFLTLSGKKNSEKLAKQSEINGRKMILVPEKVKKIGLNKSEESQNTTDTQPFSLKQEKNEQKTDVLGVRQPDKVVFSVITAYTSTPGQTDDTPFIGASGKHVYDGMIAANWLPFGTKIKIPELYGDKIFTVDDRMNKRYGYGRMDIWLDTTVAEARQFGVKRVNVEVYYEDNQKAKTLAAAK